MAIQKPIRLDGQVIVITGAARGLGAAYAMECGKRGAALLLTDKDADQLEGLVNKINSLGGIARSVVGDITDADFVESLAIECQNRWGLITGWINNAGVQLLAPITDPNHKAAELVVQVNLMGTIYGTSTAARYMAQSGGGSIINVTSGAAFGMKHLGVYGATKGAVASFTHSAAIDLQDTPVRVMCLSPLAHTRMAKDGDRHFTDLMGTPVNAADSLPSTEEVAKIVPFLLTPQSSHLSGQVIRFDGKSLSAVTRAAINVDSSVTRASWSSEDLAEALTGPLAAFFQTNTFLSPARQQAEA